MQRNSVQNNALNVANASNVSFNKYANWLARLNRIRYAYDNDLILEENLAKFQLFLLETGQFNANFTLEELNRLNYPLSPFAMMHRHTYLRATDTWSMEILRSIYLKSVNVKRLFPIWIDSNLFWNELSRYCKVVRENNINGSSISDIVNQLVLNEGQLKQPIWFRLNNKQDQNFNDCKKIENTIKDKLLEAVLKNNNIDEILLPVFKHISSNATGKAPSNTNVLNTLENVFPQIKKDAQAQFEAFKNKLTSTTDFSNCDEQFFKGVFSNAKKYKVNFPVDIKKSENLKEYAQKSENQTTFSSFLNTLSFKLQLEAPKVGAYIQLIQKWLSTHLESLLKKLSQQTVYYFEDKFEKIEAIVLCDCEKEPEFVSSVMGNIGYRIDPVRAIRSILAIFPKLFIDKKQTEDFWMYLLKTSMVSSLDEEEKQIIEAMGQHIITAPVSVNLYQHSFDLDLISLKNKLPTLRDGFKLYGKYIYDYLKLYTELYNANTGIRQVADPEICKALKDFLQACRQNNLATTIRCAQVITEVLILDLEHCPLIKLLPTLITEQYLQEYPAQQVMVTPYAMRSFVRVFQILEGQYTAIPLKIAVTNQSYFEWLHNLERLDIQKTVVSFVRHLSEIDSTSDVIFAEIHPNNVVESKQFAHDIAGLIYQMNQVWTPKQRTLVIDATLNALNDEEVQQFLKDASHLVETGWLNIILIQSLTKFSQLGLDKRSAGVVTIINNKEAWPFVNTNLNKLSQIEPVDSSTLNFFSYFAGLKTLTRDYIQQVNRNVRFVYRNIMEQFNRLEILSRERFQITMSSDPKACYVALNMNGLLPEVDEGFILNLNDIEDFSSDVLKHLIHPLCALFKLPLTERMSIGFPLSSVNSVFDSMRFTIGLESDNQLKLYSEILAYVAFVLNRQRDPKLFFDRNLSNEYKLRLNYFKEKVMQFRAMMPGMNFPYETFFIVDNQLERGIKINNGSITLYRQTQINSTLYYTYSPQHIDVPIRGVGYISLNDPRISLSEKRMVIACLTEYAREECKQKHKDYQNVNIGFDDGNYRVALDSMEILGLWNAGYAYGPFYLNRLPIFFYLYQKQISLGFNGLVFREANILIKQDNIITPLLDMPIEDREFFFSEGPYTPDRSMRSFPYQVPRGDMQWLPNKNDPIRFFIQNNKLIIERDFVCSKKQSTSVYKRYLGNNITSFEVDCWGEKNPVLARFMRLMIAIYIQDKENVNFLARNTRFTHFLFNLAFDNSDILFSEAIERVSSKKNALNELVNNYQRPENSNQHFFFRNSSRQLNWPSGYSGKNYTKDKELVEQALSILKK